MVSPLLRVVISFHFSFRFKVFRREGWRQGRARGYSSPLEHADINRGSNRPTTRRIPSPLYIAFKNTNGWRLLCFNW